MVCKEDTMYKEIFYSPFEVNTKEEAESILSQIREAHPASSGWKELNAFVEQLPNGKFRAVREHEKA